MPCHAFTERVLLLAGGERIVSEAQVERLSRPDVIFSDYAPAKFAHAIRERQRALGISAPDLQGARELDAGSQPGAAVPHPSASPAEPTSAAPTPPTPFAQEVVAARGLRRVAMRQVADLLQQARAGQPIDVQPLRGTVRQVVDSLSRNQRAFVSLMQLKSMDTYTFTHSVNNCVLSVILAKHNGHGLEAEAIGLGALMHDIGKVRLPEAVLQKEDALTPDEWDLMKQHPTIGVEIIGSSSELSQATLDAVGQHHERLDGSGYPRGLKDADIAPAARMVALTDVYDAMTSERPYHPAFAPPEAMRWIFQHSGELFDPQVVRTFIASIGLFPVGSLVRLSTGERAVVADVNPQAIRRPMVLVVADASGAARSGPARLDLSQAMAANIEILGVEPARDLSLDIDACLAMLPALPEVSVAGLNRLA
jgi:putative nucleotidyltransferase with HDIG domain